MFTERLNLLLDALGASGTQISALAGFDRSNISHLRRGTKTPRPTSRTSRKLVAGLCLYAENEHLTGLLCEKIGAPQDLSGEALRETLSGWLYEGTQEAGSEKASGSVPGRSIAFQSFADRLDAAMTIAAISNIRLSQMICVDASLISRYRSGERSPKSNPDLAGQISEILWQRILKDEKLPELQKLIQSGSDKITELEFTNWLCQFDTPFDSGASSAERLLKKFDSYSAEIRRPLPSPEKAAPEMVLKDTRELYTGTEGLREAVLRFLGTVAKSDARELLLYSDQTMDWMTGDPGFLMKWAALMNACVKKGIRIRIIHNIDRSLQEMNDAIVSWLPLYMSGMIESYYSRKKNEGKFSHTMFLCPGLCCINAWHVTGTENQGIYHYDTDRKRLSIWEAAFQELMAWSLPLIRIIPAAQDRLAGGTILLRAAGGQKVLTGSPMTNMMITISQDDVLVTRTTEPQLSFRFTHPLMCLAFRSYAEEFERTRNQT